MFDDGGKERNRCRVYADFSAAGKRMVRTEDAAKYVKLGWETGTVNLIYSKR